MNKKTLDALVRLWLTWIWAYLILGGISSMNHRTSFLAAPMDHPLPFWFKLVFLNVPLQIGMALTAIVLMKRGDGETPLGVRFLAYSTTALIAANLLTAIVVALR